MNELILIFQIIFNIFSFIFENLSIIIIIISEVFNEAWQTNMFTNTY